MSAPRISILLTTYNALDYLRLCIRSLLEHSSEAHQIVVYADGSKSATREYLETLNHPNIKWRHEPQNVGITRALNRAAAMADGEWLYFINDDMVFAPGWDTNFIKHMQLNRVLTGTVIEPEQPNVGVARCHITKNYGLSHETFDWEGFVREAPTLAADEVEPGINYPFLIQKTFYDGIGGIDERFSGPVHDPDLFYRIALAGAEMMRVRDSLCYHFSGRTLRFADGTARVSQAWIEGETAGKIAFLQKWGDRQHYSFGGVPHPRGKNFDQKWPLPVRIKLSLMARRYRKRAARQIAAIQARESAEKHAQNVNSAS
jgi:GT2 family glycosyltransferase